MLLSKADAARALGVSPGAITKAVKEGRLSVVQSHDGREMINGETLRSEWDARTQAKMRPVTARRQAPRPRHQSGDVPDYNESRARTEYLKAELLELERAQKEGELISAEEVSKKWGELVAIARTKVLGVPSKAKQRIPDFPQDAFVILEDIVREALEELADG